MTRLVAKQMMMSDMPILPSSDQSIQHLKVGEDDSYFDSYGHFSIHQDMLQVRHFFFYRKNVGTEAYKNRLILIYNMYDIHVHANFEDDVLCTIF